MIVPALPGRAPAKPQTLAGHSRRLAGTFPDGPGLAESLHHAGGPPNTVRCPVLFRARRVAAHLLPPSILPLPLCGWAGTPGHLGLIVQAVSVGDCPLMEGLEGTAQPRLPAGAGYKPDQAHYDDRGGGYRNEGQERTTQSNEHWRPPAKATANATPSRPRDAAAYARLPRLSLHSSNT